jgi:hypothetical protein
MHLDEARGRRRQGAGQSEQCGFGVAAARSCREAGPGPGWGGMERATLSQANLKPGPIVPSSMGGASAEDTRLKCRRWRGKRRRGWVQNAGTEAVKALEQCRRVVEAAARLIAWTEAPWQCCIRLTADTRPDSRRARAVARRASTA